MGAGRAGAAGVDIETFFFLETIGGFWSSAGQKAIQAAAVFFFMYH